MTTLEKAYSALYARAYGEDTTGEVADWIEFGCDDVAETAETVVQFQESGWTVRATDENGVIDLAKSFHNARRGKTYDKIIHVFDAGDKRYVMK